VPQRNQVKIRRHINRLKDLIDRDAAKQPALKAIETAVASAASSVNTAWATYRDASVAADKERAERDSAMARLVKWGQKWRPVVLLSVPGGNENLGFISPRGATPDDIIRGNANLLDFIETNPGAASYKAAAVADLGEALDAAKKENSEAVAALPVQQAARQAFTTATLAANTSLVYGSEVVRAIYGPTSSEYKQFIAKASAKEEEEETVEAATGEGATPTSSTPTT
jgi:hypothetical protein